MIKFPMKFEVMANASSSVQCCWTSQTDNLPPIPSAIPPEFLGPGGGYSPEDLFALAVLNCIIATFKVYAEKGKVNFDKIDGKAVLTVDRIPQEAGFGMTQIDLSLNVFGALDIDKTRKTIELAIKDCAVSNSIKSGKTFHINVYGPN